MKGDVEALYMDRDLKLSGSTPFTMRTDDASRSFDHVVMPP